MFSTLLDIAVNFTFRDSFTASTHILRKIVLIMNQISLILVVASTWNVSKIFQSIMCIIFSSDFHYITIALNICFRSTWALMFSEATMKEQASKQIEFSVKKFTQGTFVKLYQNRGPTATFFLESAHCIQRPLWMCGWFCGNFCQRSGVARMLPLSHFDWNTDNDCHYGLHNE